MALNLSPENELRIFECVKRLGFEESDFTFNSTDYDSNYADKDKMYLIKYNVNKDYICQLFKSALTKVSYYPYTNPANLDLTKKSFVSNNNYLPIDFYLKYIEDWLNEIKHQNEIRKKHQSIFNKEVKPLLLIKSNIPNERFNETEKEYYVSELDKVRQEFQRKIDELKTQQKEDIDNIVADAIKDFNYVIEQIEILTEAVQTTNKTIFEKVVEGVKSHMVKTMTLKSLNEALLIFQKHFGLDIEVLKKFIA